MKHHVAKKPPDNIVDQLREDPALRALFRAKTPTALNTLIAGLTPAQRNAALDGLLRLAWVQLRRLGKD